MSGFGQKHSARDVRCLGEAGTIPAQDGICIVCIRRRPLWSSSNNWTENSLFHDTFAKSSIQEKGTERSAGLLKRPIVLGQAVPDSKLRFKTRSVMTNFRVHPSLNAVSSISKTEEKEKLTREIFRRLKA
jgi:hypothetical protein